MCAPAGDGDLHNSLPAVDRGQLRAGLLHKGVVLLRVLQRQAAGLPARLLVCGRCMAGRCLLVEPAS